MEADEAVKRVAGLRAKLPRKLRESRFSLAKDGRVYAKTGKRYRAVPRELRDLCREVELIERGLESVRRTSTEPVEIGRPEPGSDRVEPPPQPEPRQEPPVAARCPICGNNVEYDEDCRVICPFHPKAFSFACRRCPPEDPRGMLYRPTEAVFWCPACGYQAASDNRLSAAGTEKRLHLAEVERRREEIARLERKKEAALRKAREYRAMSEGIAAMMRSMRRDEDARTATMEAKRRELAEDTKRLYAERERLRREVSGLRRAGLVENGRVAATGGEKDG